MSNTPSSGGDAPNMQAKIRSRYHGQKPEIKITVHNQQKTYTTLERLEGVVTIISPCDLSFDAIDVEFIGTSRTSVERLTTAAAISGRSEAFHQFLKLRQPDLEEQYPEGRVLLAGQKYDFPFVFAIPDQLLPKVCQHKVVCDTVRDAHLSLPPTLGCASAAEKDEIDGEDKAVLDDMCSDMASICYGVFAKVSKTQDQGGKSVQTTIESKAKQVRVIPARSEEPPLDTEGNDTEYTMRKERTIRKGVLKGKLGTLVMEAVQPRGMVLRTGSEFHSNSMATVRLRFDPSDDKALPPDLGSMDSKLKVCTYFASTARPTFPGKSTAVSDLSQGMHCEQLDLPKRNVAKTKWTKHEAGKRPVLERHDSAQSVHSTHGRIFTEPSAAYKGGPYFTAVLEMPITLPTNKTFVPTFHTCLVSRVYQLKFELQAAGTVSTVGLKVPFQITSASPDSRDSSRRTSLSSAASEDNEDSVDDFFSQFRNTTLPPDYSRLAFRTNEAPPGYASFAPRALPVY